VSKRQAGFTLMEVMIGLALLGVALTVLIQSAANSIFNAQQARMMGIATDLSRGLMYEIEEKLIKDGFTDTDQSEGDIGEAEKGENASRDIKSRSGKCLEDEGWPNVCYAYRVEQVELPSFDELQRMTRSQGSAAGSGSGSGSGEEVGGFENSALGGMLSSLGGGFGGGAAASGDVESAQGASFIQSQYSMVQQVLKVSIRKVTLVVWWDVMGRERDLKTVAFFTDASAMDKVMMGLGSQDLDDTPAPSGGGTTPKNPATPGKGSAK
jgi:prepilin-type N-terminal cleavage/methylation domain-containing protein